MESLSRGRRVQRGVWEKERQFNRGYKQMAAFINEGIEDGSLKFNIDVAGKRINAMEEIAGASIVITSDEHNRLVIGILENISPIQWNRMLNPEKWYRHIDYKILNMTNNAINTYERYLTMELCKNRVRDIGWLLASIVLGTVDLCLERDGDRTSFDHGIDGCVLATTLYWAEQKGLLDIIRNNNEFDPLQEIGLDENYENTLINIAGEMGKLYYAAKTRELRWEEFVRIVVSEHGKLPVPVNCELVTSPEYSMGVVRDIVSGAKLQELDYSDEVKMVISQIFQHFYTNCYFMVSKLYERTLMGQYMLAKIDDLLNSIETVNKYKRKSEEVSEELKDYKRMNRKLREEFKRIEGVNIELRNKLKSLEDELKMLEASGYRDVTPYEAKILGQESQIEELTRRIIDIERDCDKKDNELYKIKRKGREVEKELVEARRVIKRLRENMSNMIVSSENEIVSTENLVAAMRDKRITIIGGDVMHSSLKGLGFNNLRLIGAGDRGVTPNEVKGSDVIVMVVNHLSHATSAGHKNTAEACGIPTMYYNGKGVSRLCRELFVFLYS